MARSQVEREDKFDVAESFRVPSSLADDEPDTVHLESTYFDTPHNDLLRQRMTLRRRTGDTDVGWQLKVPHGAARLEVRLPPEAGEHNVPAQLADLVSGVSLGEALAPVAVLRTERRRYYVRAGDRVLAQVADDMVHAAATGEFARVSRWREVEVELVAGDEEVLARVGRKLRAAGASPAGATSKVARAIGYRPPAAVDPSDAVDLVRSYLADQYAALAAGDVTLRRGLGAVHKTRVAARRIRSVVRVLGPLVDRQAAAHLDVELSWYQDLLGAVRDGQVQRARFADLITRLPPELVLGPIAADLESDLTAVQARALATVRQALDGDRYRRLMRTLRNWAKQPPLAPDLRPDDLLRRARKAHRKAERRRASAARSKDGVALHQARKGVKRSRYAAELVRPAVGSAAKKAIKRHKRVQDVLGEHQDSVVASAHLRRLGAAASRSGRNGFTFGLLYAHEERRQAELADRATQLRL